MSVEERVIKVLCDRININKNLLVVENYDKPLTGKIFVKDARDLVYILYEIEKEFQIKIDCNKLINYRFNTIGGIIDVVTEALA